jgi:hypothetical protein
MVKPSLDVVDNGTVWVVFCDAPRTPLLWFLGRQFKHCFMVMQNDHATITIDPLWRRLDVRMYPAAHAETLIKLFKDQRLVVVKIEQFSPINLGSVLWLPSCVGVVKRILGRTEPWVITPYQLYRLLTRPGSTRTHRTIHNPSSQP